METQTWLSRHNEFSSAENITILSVLSDDNIYIYIYIYRVKFIYYIIHASVYER